MTKLKAVHLIHRKQSLVPERCLMQSAVADTDETLEMVNIDRVARSFDVHPITIKRRVAAGEFPPPIKVGPRLDRWHKLTLEKWVNSGCPAITK